MCRWAIASAILIVGSCSRGPDPKELYSQAWSKFQEGRLSEAGNIAAESLGIDPDLPPAKLDLKSEDRQRLYLLYCEILLAKGHAPEALIGLNLLTPATPELRARWLIDRADGLNKKDRRDEVSLLLDQVETTLAVRPDPYLQFKALMLRSSVLTRHGKFDESEAVLRKGLQLAIDRNSDYQQAAALLNLSFRRLAPGTYDESLQFAKMSLDAARRANAGQLVATAENNIGISYRVLGDLDQAEEFENEAIKQLRQIQDLRNLQDALGELGSIHLERHQPARAAQDFEKAFKIAMNIQSPLAAGRWAGQTAAAMIEEKNWNKAEEWNRRAYDLYRQTEPSDEILVIQLNEAAIAFARGKLDDAMTLYRDAVEKGVGDEFVERTAHIGVARLLKEKELWEQAEQEYEKGLALIDKRTQRFGPTYLDLRIQSFKEYVELLVSRDNTDRALQVVESSRARMLREKLGLPAYGIDQVDLKQLRRYARQTGSVLLSYWLAPERSFVWVVKPESIHMRELPKAEQLEPAIRDYRKMIEDSRDPVAQEIPKAKHLGEMLLNPIMDDLAGAERIVIVPDGPLHALNLEALIVPGTNRYWIEDAQISIAPSLSILVASSPTKPSKPSLLLVGAPHSPDSVAFPDLPAALAEISSIEKHFPTASVSVQTGNNATPKSFHQARPERFSMIHFATHAEANQKSPLDSAVILSQSDDRYKLYASEIAGLKLSADLVTLSACRSAGARAYGGEGLVGFAWAFLQSGAHAVVAGLWDVGDISSSELMDNLYLELSRGATPASALRQAKLNMLRPGSPYRKPIFWAPFQIFIR